MRKKIFSSIIAVSYTHLRAHETVLDLVCRLLLEKKTKPHLPPPSLPFSHPHFPSPYPFVYSRSIFLIAYTSLL
ncbi:hypothetical protein PVA38_12195 [Streptococcus pneumoniae D39]|nr:hypothetical protein PVA38_12195 [Streptococcus pneumoniae D39]